MKKLYIALICLSVIMIGVFGALFIKDSFFSSAATADSASPQPNAEFTVSVPQGESSVLSLTVEEENAVESWKTLNNELLSVDSGGRIDARRQGEATVYANFADGHANIYHVTVTAPQEQPKKDMLTTAVTANADIAAENVKCADKKLPYEIHVNRKQNCVTVYTYDKDGKYTVPVRSMVCSCGLNNTTETGEFHIYFHAEWHPLVNNVFGQYSSAFHDDLLFHSVPYTDLSPDTLKTAEFNKLGEPASRGCVRMMVSDCKWICDNCAEDTVVKILDSDEAPPLGKPATIKLTDKTLGWDPTDSNPKNPYLTKVPVIAGAKSVTIKKGASYSVTDGVTAVDSCGNDITAQLEVMGNVNPNRAGKYHITYTVTDALHRGAREDITVTVEE